MAYNPDFIQFNFGILFGGKPKKLLYYAGLFDLKVKYGLVAIPYWMKPHYSGLPITDTRRLLN